jgi:hypothetical protein
VLQAEIVILWWSFARRLLPFDRAEDKVSVEEPPARIGLESPEEGSARDIVDRSFLWQRRAPESCGARR